MSYKYMWPQPSLSLNHNSSLVFDRYFQFTLSLPLSKNFSADSVITSRTSPVEASATRIHSCLCSRDVETNASCLPSSLHCTSSHPLPPRQLTSSHKVERC